MSTAVLIVAMARVKEFFGFTAMKPDLTLLHRSRDFNCYVTWSSSTWPRTFESQDVSLGSLTECQGHCGSKYAIPYFGPFHIVLEQL